jgi:hypothetical protein
MNNIKMEVMTKISSSLKRPGLLRFTNGNPLANIARNIGVRDMRARGATPPPQILERPWKFGHMLRKIKKIRADSSENRLNSGNFITILHKNSGKLSTAPLESISPVRL